MVPMAIEWSPPRTSGNRPAARVDETRSQRREQAVSITSRYRCEGSPGSRVSGMGISMSPPSCDGISARSSAASRPAIRIAVGPIDTPLRPAPWSSGIPITSTDDSLALIVVLRLAGWPLDLSRDFSSTVRA